MSGQIGVLSSFNSAVDDIEAWIGMFDNFLLANSLDKTKDKQRAVAVLLSSLNLQTYGLLKDLVSPDKPESKSLDDLTKVLVTHFKPAPKAIAERFKFFNKKQQQGETVAQFLAELRKLAITCKFSDLDTALRDQFVCGLAKAAQRRLFCEDDAVKLDKVVALATSHEAAEASTSIVRNHAPPDSVEVEAKKVSNRKASPTPKNASKSQGQQNQKSCGNCGRSQQKSKDDCPAKAATCRKCSKMGHFGIVCRSSSKPQRRAKQKEQTHYVEDDDEESNIYNIRQILPIDDVIKVKLTINGSPPTLELDTGSKRSILSESFWRNTLGSPPLAPSNLTFVTYTKERFRAQGQLECKVTYKNQIVSHVFHIVKGDSLFGRDLLRTLKLDWSEIKAQCHSVTEGSSEPLTLKSILHEFKEVFSTPIGRIKDFKARIVLREGATPKFMKSRQIPFALREKVDKELDHMEATGILERVEHSDWASPLVVVPKANGKVRITGDFKNTVNNQLCVNQYPFARVNEILEKVSGGSKFSKLDGSDAFYQLELEESSKKFLVVNTHRGLYQYNVLPQGIASSPAIFQEVMDRMLKDVPMAASFLDDSLCSGRNDKEHLDTLRQVLQRMKNSNYRLSKSKCLFLQPTLEYLGFVISENGIHTSPEKIEAICSMKEPSTVKELKSFLGLVNFYGQFVPELADLCEPLYRLTQVKVKWSWTKQCKDAFQSVKKKLVSSPTLTHFDQKKEIGISCDASSIGLGVVLFHIDPDGSERPIAFASKTLSPTERRYSQIEKEGLSIVYGVKKIFNYLCGRKFTLVTDHKPLIAIFGPNHHIPSLAAARLHRWALYLSGFEFSIVFRPTAQHGNADALSRLPLKDENDTEPEVEDEICQIFHTTTDYLPVTARKIRQESSKDKTLSRVIHFLENGWPTDTKAIPENIKPFYPHREELTFVQGVLMWGIRVVIPSKYRNAILNELHDTHSGIVRMKSIARQFVWWPGIDKDIELLAKSCRNCAQVQPSPASAPLHPWCFPEKPWQRLHADLAGPFLGSNWLIVVDAHSKWPEVFRMNQNTTSAAVIRFLRETFARFGIPEQIVSDNGPQFVSKEFKDFCAGNAVKHSTSSAYHPRSNIEAERFIRTFKDAMNASSGRNPDQFLQKFLLNYRTTAHATTYTPPCDLLLRRRPRTLLDCVRPSVTSSVANAQSRQKSQYDRNVKTREFKVGRKVWVQTHIPSEPKWSFGSITGQQGPVSYMVETNGRKLKRHVDHIVNAEVQTGFRFATKEPDIITIPDSPDGSFNSAATSPASTPGSPGTSESWSPTSPSSSDSTIASPAPPLAQSRPQRSGKPVQRYRP